MDKTVMETKDVRVLVVEDNPEDFQILQVLFSKIKNRRYKLENVLNLSKALEALRRREHEVYLVDYQLGPDSGIDFLKEAAAANCAAPSILLTGYGNPELDLKAMSLGAADFLSKNDLNPVILERSVRYALEHKRVEESVRRQEEFFRAMIENAQDGVMLIDADGKTRYASPSIEWILGYTQQERIGQDLFSLIHPEDLRIAKDLFTQSFNSSDKVFKAEFRTKHKGGSWRLIEATGKSHEFKSPDFTGVVLNYRDITEQKKAEESLKKHEDQMRLAQKMDAIGRLAGGVAHDFNNLLSVIGGNAYFVISSMEKDNPQRVELGEIQKAVRHGAELTKQLLVFGQKQVSQPRPVNLNDLSVEMNKMFKRLIDATIHLSIIQEKDLRSILVDPGQMQQVILNLVLNARDAMPKGGDLIIEIENVRKKELNEEKRPTLPSGDYVCLNVTDTGTGMSPDIQKHIFEPFFTTKADKGTGLGLATVYGIVKNWSGHIFVHSTPGLGTTFTLYFPALQAVEKTEAKPKQIALIPQGSETILLAEDEEPVRKVLVRTLEKYGYHVLEAKNGIEAVQKAWDYRGPIHLLMTDAVMPKMNGKELADEINKSHPKTKVLFVSGYAREVLTQKGILDSNIHLFQKPFELEDLVLEIRKILDEK